MLWQKITGTINYVALINNIINKGYAEEVPQLSLEADLSKVWSISHDGVYHPIKPEEIRVVFNCSTKFAGTSLVEYGMTVLSFDDASSPSCSRCALWKTANNIDRRIWKCCCKNDVLQLLRRQLPQFCLVQKPNPRNKEKMCAKHALKVDFVINHEIFVGSTYFHTLLRPYILLMFSMIVRPYIKIYFSTLLQRYILISFSTLLRQYTFILFATLLWQYITLSDKNNNRLIPPHISQISGL